MIIKISNESSIIRWKNDDKEKWNVAVISDLIKAYERPQGEWLMDSKLYDGFGDSVLAITCSICKASFVYRGKTHNYCPNCGAAMKQQEVQE